MSSVGSKGVIIQDALGGDAVTVTDGKLDVNATVSLSLDSEGTDGNAGPTKALSIAGTESGGNLQELLVDGDGHLQVDVLSGGGGGGSGTEYTEGDTDSSITGTAMLWEDTSETLRAISTAKPLPVDLGANNDVTVTGTITANAGSGTMAVDGSGVTQPVSGTFWQTTQPVSIASMPTTAVTGTFWQSTQPVSGTVTANAGTGTLAVSNAALDELGTAINASDQVDVNIASGGFNGAVTGTFWQTTQPVSGTFWQTTQPVSLASAPTTAVTNAGLTELAAAINSDKVDINIESGGFDGAITSIIPGVGATNLGKEQDEQFVQGHVGVMPLAIRKDGNPINVSGTSTDYAPLQVSEQGALWIEPVGKGGVPLGHREDTTHENGDAGIMALGVRKDVAEELCPNNQYHPFIINPSGAVYTTHGITGGGQGIKVTTGAGDHIVLGGDVACSKIDIQAQTDNTGLIAVGFTSVDATEATGDGIILRAGDTYSLEINNLNLIYIDSTVTGEGVRYTYFT